MFKLPLNITLHETDPVSRAVVAAYFVAWSHLALLLAIQLENYFLYLRPVAHSVTVLPFLLTSLGIAQWENILVAAALGILTLAAASIRPGRWFAFLAVTLANLYLVLDQLGFKLFFDHFQASKLQDMHLLTGLLLSSMAQLDGAFYGNALLFLSITGALAFLLFRTSAPQRIRPHAHISGLLRSPKVWTALVVFTIVSMLFPMRADYGKLYHHPFHNLLASPGGPPQTPAVTVASPAAPPQTINGDPRDPRRLRFGEITADPANDQRLESLLQESQTHKPRWNIIWIVMTSVGSKQFLAADGLPDPTITPFLSRLAQHALIFDSVYSVFPGTARSHVDMLTGGRTLTWGGIFNELSYPYEGPTLPRALAADGYDTALFSARKLDFENLNAFYKRAGYGYYYDFGEADPDFQQQNALQAQGAKEQPILSLAVKWIDKRRDPARPFFLQYLTVATYHPYDIPFDYRGPVRGTTRKENYSNALNYTDASLGLLVAQLNARHLLDNTLIIVSGDHGEAFGDYHGQNFLHENFLYEENIKDFLLIANPVLFPDTVSSPRVASSGDIMPTILAMSGAPPSDVPGQDILSKDYTPRLVYFYKNTNPETWGLRDGQWKFTSAGAGGNALLYNLSTDRDETSDIAGIYPDRVALYNRLAARWYVDTNRDFVARLKDFHYPGGKELSEADLQTAGPKLLAFGYNPSKRRGADDAFIEANSFNPYEKVVAWTRWVNYPLTKTIHYVWKPPSGEPYEVDYNLDTISTSTRVDSELPLPMEEGTWQLSLQDGDQTLIAGTFAVDRNAPLHIQRDTEAQAKEITVGKYVLTEFGKEEFSSTATLRPNDHIVIWTRWKPLDHKRRIDYRWKSPSGQLTEFYFDVKDFWDQTWVNLNNDQPLESGHWEVTLWDGKRRLGGTAFNVAPAGAL